MQPNTQALIDSYGRRVEYLRLSLTDRCDLRCVYCIPKGYRDFEEPGDWLSFDEITRIVRVFSGLGLRRLRLTGGEPLLRRGICDLVSQLSRDNDLEDISLSTNATQLGKCAKPLHAAGVSRLNVSLDTLDRQRFEKITGRDVLPDVLTGIDSAVDAGFSPIKINMVVMKGVNEDEVDAMVDYCRDRGLVLRLIEAMPVGDTGRSVGFVDLGPIRRRLQKQFDLIDGVVPGGGPARYIVSKDRRINIGFITPLSQHFCATCNRVRLTVDGTLCLCLGQEDQVDLRALVRSGCSDEELKRAICEGIARKPERHEFKEAPHRVIRVMTKTGG